MNKNLFRIIFNKRRGQLMAVAETSSSQGKGSRGEAVTSGHPATAEYATVAISTLSLSVLCALGAVLWALPTPDAHAQVVAYRQAPRNQQAPVLQTANVVPQACLVMFTASLMCKATGPSSITVKTMLKPNSAPGYKPTLG